MAAMDLSSLKTHIRQVCGLTFEEDRESVLTGALRTRMLAAQAPNLEDYLRRVVLDDQEFQSLVNLLTINETYFFRESQHLSLLTDHILPKRIAALQENKRIRILSAGCATGEEPYSVAVAILEKFGKTASTIFSLIGADIDSAVLDRARTAVYSGLSFRNMPQETAAKWFTPCGAARYRLDNDARAMVTFQRLNLMDDVYPDELHGQDIILFRNVSIYFDTDVRRSVQAKLAALLNTDGVLIVGLTETLSNDFGQLSLVSEGDVFYFVKSAASVPKAKAAKPQPRPSRQPSLRPVPAVRQPIQIQARPPKIENPAATIDHAVTCLREKRYDEALSTLDALEGSQPDDARHHVMRALIAFNRKDMAAAAAAAAKALTTDEWNLDARLLLAQMARLGGQREDAEKHLKQIIYAEPRCWPAHYWLAELYRGWGERDKAGREYRVVVNQTAGPCDINGGLLLFPLGVSPTEVGALCRRQLQSLGFDR